MRKLSGLRALEMEILDDCDRGAKFKGCKVYCFLCFVSPGNRRMSQRVFISLPTYDEDMSKLVRFLIALGPKRTGAQSLPVRFFISY